VVVVGYFISIYLNKDSTLIKLGVLKIKNFISEESWLVLLNLLSEIISGNKALLPFIVKVLFLQEFSSSHLLLIFVFFFHFISEIKLTNIIFLQFLLFVFIFKKFCILRNFYNLKIGIMKGINLWKMHHYTSSIWNMCCYWQLMTCRTDAWRVNLQKLKQLVW